MSSTLPDEVTTRCAIYCRVSTKEQLSNLSLDTQQERCSAHAMAQGWIVDAVFVEEGESAKTTDRPELQRLLDYCRERRGRVQFVLVYALNRLARNTHDHLVLRGVLAGAGAQLRSVTEPVEEGSAGRFVETLLAAVAQFDNDVRAERTVAGMRASIARGRWPHLAPLGYRNVRDESGKPTLAPDPERAPLIRQAFEWAAAGEAQSAILERLRARGLRARKGGLVALETLAHMLRNPLYTARLRSAAWGVEALADFPPLVDEATFRAAQAALSRGTSPVHKRQRPDFPLKHFIRCDGCSRPLTAAWSRGRSARYPYYACPRGHVRARRETVEDAFIELVNELRPSPAYLKLFRAIVLDVWNARIAEAAAEGGALQRRARDLRERRERLVEAFVYQQALDRATFDNMKRNLEAELLAVEDEQAQAQADRLDAAALVDYAVNVVVNAGVLWRDVNPEQRLQLQAFLFPSGLRWNGRELIRTGVQSLFYSDLEAETGPKSAVATLEPPSSNRIAEFLEAAEQLRIALPLAA